MLANIIIVTIIAAIVVSIIVYLVRAKMRGETCVGCPYAKQCGSSECSSNCKKQ